MSLRDRLTGALGGARLLIGGRTRTSGAVVLAYHDVRPDIDADPGYSVRPSTFARHLRQLAAAGVRVVELGELTDRLLRSEPIDGLAAIVFDDALVGVHRHAAPLLADAGVPATVFAVSGVLGRTPPWWPGAQRTLTEAEVLELRDAGWSVGAHTRTHPSLPTLTAAEQRAELEGSRAELEDLVQEPVELLAYPFGHHDPGVRARALEAGYTVGFTFLNGRLSHDLDRFRLPRLTMTEGHGRLRLAYHLARSAGSWPDHQLESFLGDGTVAL